MKEKVIFNPASEQSNGLRSNLNVTKVMIVMIVMIVRFYFCMRHYNYFDPRAKFQMLQNFDYM